MCILDGMVTVFNLDSMALIQQLAGTKGCTVYSTNEQMNLLLAAGKKKIDLYVWEESHGLVHKREIPLSDSPKLLCCLSSGTAAVVGKCLIFHVLHDDVACKVFYKYCLIQVSRGRMNL